MKVLLKKILKLKKFLFLKLFFINTYYYALYRVLPFKSIIKVIETISINIKKNEELDINLVSKYQNKISTFIYDSKCIISSIALYSFFRKNGFKTKIFIGVCLDKNKFKSHAWIEVQNIKLLYPDNGLYKIIYEAE